MSDIEFQDDCVSLHDSDIIKLHEDFVNTFKIELSSYVSTEKLRQMSESSAVVSTRSACPCGVSSWNRQIALAVKEYCTRLYNEFIEADDSVSCFALDDYYTNKRKLRQQCLSPVIDYTSTDDLDDLCEILECTERAMEQDCSLDVTLRQLILHFETSKHIEKIQFMKNKEYEKVLISTVESNKLHDKQVQEMKELVAYYKLLHDLRLKEAENLKAVGRTENTTYAMLRIQIANLKAEIEAKNRYIEMYDKRRTAGGMKR
jgi:hypothetical protein